MFTDIPILEQKSKKKVDTVIQILTVEQEVCRKEIESSKKTIKINKSLKGRKRKRIRPSELISKPAT